MKFEQILLGDKQYPAAITNYSLAMGEKIGLIKDSQLTSFLETSYLNLIYLSVIGVNKHLDLSFEQFLENYLISDKIMNHNYKNLVTACTDKKTNKFAKGFTGSTSKKVEKNQKKIKSPPLNFECVEDRYVWYCLIYGVESDVFWHFPILDVERIMESKQAYEGWKNNPK
jgi:hypothetical protein